MSALLVIPSDQPMPNLTVTAKGQITRRRELLQYLGIQPGQQATVDELAGGVLAQLPRHHMGWRPSLAACRRRPRP